MKVLIIALTWAYKISKKYKFYHNISPQNNSTQGDSTVAIIFYVCCAYEFKKPYPSFSANPQPFAPQYKHNHSTERHTSLNCASYVRLLFLNFIKSLRESPIGRRVTIITQTLDRMKLWCFTCITEN